MSTTLIILILLSLAYTLVVGLVFYTIGYSVSRKDIIRSYDQELDNIFNPLKKSI